MEEKQKRKEGEQDLEANYKCWGGGIKEIRFGLCVFLPRVVDSQLVECVMDCSSPLLLLCLCCGAASPVCASCRILLLGILYACLADTVLLN